MVNDIKQQEVIKKTRKLENKGGGEHFDLGSGCWFPSLADGILPKEVIGWMVSCVQVLELIICSFPLNYTMALSLLLVT